jgi:hypothetical protein
LSRSRIEHDLVVYDRFNIEMAAKTMAVFLRYLCGAAEVTYYGAPPDPSRTKTAFSETFIYAFEGRALSGDSDLYRAMCCNRDCARIFDYPPGKEQVQMMAVMWNTMEGGWAYDFRVGHMGEAELNAVKNSTIAVDKVLPHLSGW